MQLTDEIDRRAGLTRDQFAREYLTPLRPVDPDRRASPLERLGRWSPQFFKTQYGHLEIKVDGETMTLGELVDRIDASTRRAARRRTCATNRCRSGHRSSVAEVLAHAGVHAAQLAREPRCSRRATDLSSVEVYIGGMAREVPGASLRQLAYPCLPDAAVRREGIRRIQPRAERVAVPGDGASAQQVADQRSCSTTRPR